MQEYQIYAFTKEGSSKPPISVTALTGEDALSFAKMTVGRDRAAVWQGDRYVGRINCPDQYPEKKERTEPGWAR